MRIRTVPALIAALCLVLGGGAPARAALGGDASSVEADRARLNGVVRVTTAAAYSVHEIQTAGGLEVREYLAPGGQVFAISWSGPRMPDLRQMLGNYFDRFQQAASTPRYNHHQLTIRTPQLVVESSGHTRAFSGRAWAPALLPQNFSPDDIS